jgi:hypothetical protein
MLLYLVSIECEIKAGAKKAGRHEIHTAMIANSPEEAADGPSRAWAVAKLLSVDESDVASIRVLFVDGGEPVHAPMPLVSWDGRTRRLLPARRSRWVSVA